MTIGKKYMKENYKFFVSLRKKLDSEVKKNIAEQEILATSSPHPTPIHTRKKYGCFLTYGYLKMCMQCQFVILYIFTCT
jgi:hypothetical protein